MNRNKLECVIIEFGCKYILKNSKTIITNCSNDENDSSEFKFQVRRSIEITAATNQRVT